MRFRVDQENSEPGVYPWQLVVNNALLADVRLFAVNQAGSCFEVSAGGDSPVDYNQSPNRAHIFNLPVIPGETNNYLLRVNAKATSLIPLLLLPEHEREKWSARRSTITSMYFGATFIMVLCFLLLSIGARNMTFGWYVGYLFSVLLFNMSMDGFTKEYIYSGHYTLSTSAYLLSYINMITGILFSSATLNTRSRTPTLHRILRFMIVFPAIGIATIPLLPILVVSKLVITLTLIFAPMLMTVSIIIYARGYEDVRFYVVGWACFLIFVTAAALSHDGLLPWTPLSNYYILIGNFLETVFLSISLVDQLNSYRKKQIENERRTKEQLQQINLKLLASSKVKDRFLATISHELRTPMHGITGALSLINSGNLATDTRNHLEIVDHSAKTMIRLVDNLISLTELSCGNTELRKTTFNVLNLAQAIERELRPVAENKGIKLQFHMTNAENKAITCDEEKLRILLFQLTDNAIKFTEQGLVDVSFSIANNNELILIVADTGKGFNPELVEFMYQPFEQADNSFKRQHGGIGIGLALCKKIVECLSGTIRIASNPNRGTHVRVNIPVLAIHQPQTTPPNIHAVDTADPGERARVLALIVEDNPVNQKVLTAMLTKLGIDSTQAYNGVEGVNKCVEQKFDIVFMDCQMPLLDGFEATRLIRKECPLNTNTPIVAVTANTSSTDRLRCQEVGMNDFLKKPMRLNDIRNVIHKHVHLSETSATEYTVSARPG